MTLRNFVKKNRKEISSSIKEYYDVEVTNDEDRREWVLNDEGWYREAIRAGCRI